MTFYVQPIAQHVRYPERLLLNGEDGRCYLWLGRDAGASLEEIDRATADWLRTLPTIRPLTGTPVWLQASDLPVAESASQARRSRN